MSMQRDTPPRFLFHGTSPEAARKIGGRWDGNMSICHRHGDRGSSRPAKIEQAGYPTLERATRARQWGWFYRGNDTVWLADFVPPSFIGEFGPTDR